MYRQGKALSKILETETTKTRTSVVAELHIPLKMLSNLLDARDDTETAVFSAIHKNFFLFFSAIDLAKLGMYGPAGNLLRPIFESVYIGKYCALSEDDRVFKAWIAGEYVHLPNEIFNRIKSSKLEETRAFWKMLNKLAHATVYAQQISTTYDEIKIEINICLSLIQVLSILNYHLLTRHYLTPKVIRYTKIYGNDVAFDAARIRARLIAGALRSSFTKDARRVIREYVSAWELKQ
jgi:hypothetical protein